MGSQYSAPIVSVGSALDLDKAANRKNAKSSINQRIGSDVYTKGMHFMIETVQMKLSSMPGAPTMPIKQWIRFKPTHPEPGRGRYNYNTHSLHHEPETVSYGGIVEDNYGEESYP